MIDMLWDALVIVIPCSWNFHGYVRFPEGISNRSPQCMFLATDGHSPWVPLGWRCPKASGSCLTCSICSWRWGISGNSSPCSASTMGSRCPKGLRLAGVAHGTWCVLIQSYISLSFLFNTIAVPQFLAVYLYNTTCIICMDWALGLQVKSASWLQAETIAQWLHHQRRNKMAHLYEASSRCIDARCSRQHSKERV